MYKIVGEERFLLWAVCSIQLQVLCGNGGEKLLLLAEGLLKKHIASHSLHEPEALIVYISLLEQQSKYRDALEILSGKLGSLIMLEVDRLRIEGRLLARAGDYVAAADVFQKVLELCPDDWEYFLHYLGCLLQDDSSWCNGTNGDPIHPSKSVDCKLSHLTDEVFDSCIANASAFVQKLLASASNDSVRCPHLAKLEIERRKFLFGKGDDDKLMEALMQYFLRFGHLACSTSDVEVFLDMLSQDKKTKLVEKLMEGCESPSITLTKALGKSITLFKVQEFLGNFFTLAVRDLEGIAVQMVEMYCKNLALSKDLDVQESMHGEELLTMASNILVQLFWRTKHLGYLVEAIMVLEFGLTIRRYVWQYKISLLHLYSHWGALSLAYQWYKSLDVKNILLETVSHHILPQMLMSPLWVDLGDLLRDYLKFMDDHFKESADLAFLAYRHRNYSKVIEFVQFKERLQRSSQYLMAQIEAPILQLKQNADNVEEEESVLESLKYGILLIELSSDIGCTSLTFNEDLQLRPWWTPTYDKNYLSGPFEGTACCPRGDKQRQIKQAEENVPKVIERRSLLPRMIYLSIQCASSFVKENIETNGSAFNSKVSLELKILLERYAKFLGFSFQDAIEVLFAISSEKKSSEALSSDLINWMNFAVFLNAWNLNSNELGPDKDTCRPDTWHIVNSLIEKYVLEKLRSMGPLISSPGCDLHLLVQLVTEPLAWHGLVVQSCVRSLHPSGKRKKKGGSAEQTNSQLSRVVSDSIQTLCCVVEEVAIWLREQIKKPMDTNMEIILSSIQVKEKSEGPGKVSQILETCVSSVSHVELGDRISQALKSWNPADVARKIVTGESTVMSQFLRICESKVKSLKALKLQV
ncbi:N-terminal acetyltransferase B complex auxiliary subunit NAA25 isoform X2 [Diospyros lotus]|nr:N-terminal acetyltransferase B complex auxiliary subunit NAA25 isoform X2 [Diospyros lotus]